MPRVRRRNITRHYGWSSIEANDTLPTRDKNILDLIHTSLAGQFKDIHSEDKLSDHDTVSRVFFFLNLHSAYEENPAKGVFI